MNIYGIVTIYLNEDKTVKRSRFIGYYSNKDVAINAILDNAGDMFECGYYNYGLVVEIQEGLYPNESIVQWIERKDSYNIFLAEDPHPIDEWQHCEWRPFCIG